MIPPLPNELLLRIYPHLSLKALILSRGVNKHWRHLVLLADLNPIRRSLFELYIRTVESPIFLRTRPWVLEHIRPFDRKAYIGALLDQHAYVPEEFCVWILEWPEGAVVGCAWPGLPETYFGDDTTNNLERHRGQGINHLCRVPPLVHTVYLNHRADTGDLVDEDVPALLTWQFHDESWIWIILDERPILRGKVYDLEGATCEEEEMDASDQSFPWIHSGWIAWQSKRLEKLERRAIELDAHPESGPYLQWFTQSDSQDRLWSMEHATGRPTSSSS
ncbi:hypothetical protein B0H11DRAFT_2214177 [Mycena galericulata]|nr:hypothetical protein B0H11DRAFT_2214177 [Mycena galericulata]